MGAMFVESLSLRFGEKLACLVSVKAPALIGLHSGVGAGCPRIRGGRQVKS
jgi:hypothetical protein